MPSCPPPAPVGNEPPNLAPNAGGECGGERPVEWSEGFPGEPPLRWVAGRDGGRAVQVVAVRKGTYENGDPRYGAEVLYRWPIPISAAAQQYCGQVWVRGTAPRVEAEFRKRMPVAGEKLSFELPLRSDPMYRDENQWFRVPPSRGTKLGALAPGETIQLVVKMFENKDGDIREGDTLVVDDIDVWASAVPMPNSCQEARR